MAITLGEGLQNYIDNPQKYDLRLNKNNVLSAGKKWAFLNRFKRLLGFGYTYKLAEITDRLIKSKDVRCKAGEFETLAERKDFCESLGRTLAGAVYGSHKVADKENIAGKVNKAIKGAALFVTKEAESHPLDYLVNAVVASLEEFPSANDPWWKGDIGKERLNKFIEIGIMNKNKVINKEKVKSLLINGEEIPYIYELDLSNKGLTSIPKELSQLPNLQVLDLRYNDLGEHLRREDPFPENFNNLVELLLSHNNISRLQNLDNLSKIQSLNFSNNGIGRLPSLSSLKELKVFDCSKNSLGWFPDVSENKELEYLDVSNNFIEALPDLSVLPKLEHFDCENNMLPTQS